MSHINSTEWVDDYTPLEHLSKNKAYYVDKIYDCITIDQNNIIVPKKEEINSQITKFLEGVQSENDIYIWEKYMNICLKNKNFLRILKKNLTTTRIQNLSNGDRFLDIRYDFLRYNNTSTFNKYFCTKHNFWQECLNNAVNSEYNNISFPLPYSSYLDNEQEDEGDLNTLLRQKKDHNIINLSPKKYQPLQNPFDDNYKELEYEDRDALFYKKLKKWISLTVHIDEFAIDGISDINISDGDISCIIRDKLGYGNIFHNGHIISNMLGISGNIYKNINCSKLFVYEVIDRSIYTGTILLPIGSNGDEVVMGEFFFYDGIIDDHFLFYDKIEDNQEE